MLSNDTQKHILIADDEQETVEQIRHVLSANFKCIVDVAYNGKEALDKLRVGEHYDLLILDILVPKLNGIEVCEFMIQDEKLKQIAVVKDVLEKPFSDSSLWSKVGKIIGKVEPLQ